MSEKLFYMRSLSLRAGINVNNADISIGPEEIDGLPLSENSKNISYGRRAGITTRYGIMPVPGHCTQEPYRTLDVGEYDGAIMYGIAGLELSQSAMANGAPVISSRTALFGAVVINVRMSTDISTAAAMNPTGNALRPVVYWIIGSNSNELCLAPSIYSAGGTTYPEVLASYLEGAAGFGGSRASNPTTVGTANDANKAFKAIDRLHSLDLSTLKVYDPLIDGNLAVVAAIPFAQIKSRIVTNIREFVGWQANAGLTAEAYVGTPGGTPRPISFGFVGTPYWCQTTSDKSAIGITLSMVSNGVNYNGAAQKNWNIISNLAASSTTTLSAGLNKNRSKKFEDDVFNGHLKYGASLTWVASGTYANDAKLLFGRVENKPYTSSVDIVAMCVNGKPKVVLFNNDLRDSTYNQTLLGNYTSAARSGHGNDLQQWIDPTNTLWKPKTHTTYDVAFPSDTYRYTETFAGAGVPLEKQTSFKRAPLFTVGTDTESTSDDGFLTLETTYELSYSIYNAMTGKESNVGDPIKVFHGNPYTESHNYVVHRSAGLPYAFGTSTPSTGMTHSYLPNLNELFPDCETSAIESLPINFLYFRMYYREIGGFEWIFAGEHSFAKVYFELWGEDVTIGSSTPVGPPGGQPGAFNDYSDLPADYYIDVKGFNDRLFWLTKGAIRYSLKNDKFSYPMRNFYPCPDGEFRGMIQHYFSGQSEQDGRLVVFGSEGIYDGKFTGQFDYMQVRVSATAEPQSVPLEGSDFKLFRRGSDTAFSGRSACIAEGTMFFMGPTGIYADNGVGLPQKISQPIEPDYFSSFNKARTKEFHAFFNKKCREVLFFYIPASTSDGYKMRAWVFSLRVGQFTQYTYRNEIPWAQNLEWTDFAIQNTSVGGSRIMIGQRLGDNTGYGYHTRPYFHDDDCEGGDSHNGYEFLVKTLTKMGSNQIKLDLALGTTTDTSVIPLGTKVGIQASTSHGALTSSQNIDGLYNVKAVGTSPNNSITVEVSAAVYAALTSPISFESFRQFPIFVGTDTATTPSIMPSTIECTLETEYLCPVSLDLWSRFRYVHLLINPTDSHPGDATTEVSLVWRMNHEIGAYSDTKTLPVTRLATNETTTQIYVDLLNSQMTAEGQAIKYKFTYNQLYQRFTLFSMTTRYQDQGEGEVKYYQRENA